MYLKTNNITLTKSRISDIWTIIRDIGGKRSYENLPPKQDLTSMLFFLCFHLSSMKYTCNMFLCFYLSVQYYCYTYNFFCSSLFLNSLRKNKGSSGGSRRSCVVRGRNEIDSTFVAICWLLVFLAFWDLSKSTKCEAVRKSQEKIETKRHPL